MHFGANFKKMCFQNVFKIFSKCVDQKYLWCSITSYEFSKSIIRFLTIVIWNLKKGKRQKLTTHLRRPVNYKPNFFTNWICYLQIRFCSYYAFWLNHMFDYYEVLKYWPLKDGLRSVSRNIFRVAILVDLDDIQWNEVATS